MRSLFDLNARRLDELFCRSPSGAVPRGWCRGTALFCTGTGLSRTVARLVGAFVWKGKIFDNDGTRLRNLASPFWIAAVPARVYGGASLLDGRPCIVVDYSRTSLVARPVRDELREVSPGLYLGRAYAFGKPVMHFALEGR